MKQAVEKQTPNGVVDYLSLAITTCGVGYIPGAPGTYGSVVAIGIYFAVERLDELYRLAFWPKEYANPSLESASVYAINALALGLFCLVGIWASGRSISFFGNSDPSQAVVDETMGQLITLTFIPFGVPWPFVLAGFLLFRLFDIWKPYPIDHLQELPGGIGICADDLLAGVYAGLCLAIGYAAYLFI